MDEDIIVIGGDYDLIFDHEEYLAMIAIPDEATCVLRGHLILEEVLNLWSNKLTKTEDLYNGGIIAFKTKLIISKNLGLSIDIYTVLDKVNKIRNRFSHRKGYKLEKSELDSLKDLVNKIVPLAKLQNCEKFDVVVGSKDKEVSHTWEESNNRIRFVIIFVILMLKLTYWLQIEFQKRSIEFTIKADN